VARAIITTETEIRTGTGEMCEELHMRTVTVIEMDMIGAMIKTEIENMGDMMAQDIAITIDIVILKIPGEMEGIGEGDSEIGRTVGTVVILTTITTGVDPHVAGTWTREHRVTSHEHAWHMSLTDRTGECTIRTQIRLVEQRVAILDRGCLAAIVQLIHHLIAVLQLARRKTNRTILP
jgi:hypothetical protein